MGKKSRNFKSQEESIQLYNKAVNHYRNKYYNLFLAQFKWNGLNYRQKDFIMRKFWDEGTVAVIKDKFVDEPIFAQWILERKDMLYGVPDAVRLVNTYNSPLIPRGSLTVDKDVCIGYIQRNHKSIYSVVNWYAERIAQVEMVINTNLQLQKMPFLLSVTEDADKVQDVINRILNNEIVITVEGFDINSINSVITETPYLIDKLVNYKVSLENELKTYLSINNNGVQKIQQLQMAEVNANNDEIMDSETNFFESLQEWCDNIKEVLGLNISVKSTSKPIKVEGQVHENEEKPGPKEEDEDDDN